MKVLKFGGTSVGTTESLRNVKSIVENLDEPAIVVVSALGGLTDNLINTARLAAEASTEVAQRHAAMAERHHRIIDDLVPEVRKSEVAAKIDTLLGELLNLYQGVALIRELPQTTLDAIVSLGERMSSIIVSNIITGARHYNSLDFIKTEKWFNKNIADIRLTEKLVRETFAGMDCPVAVCGGFISTDSSDGRITNLGRGGSDYTAAIIAASLEARSLEIWTDVDGFMTADPRLISDAFVVPEMSFVESMELCSFGAKVIYPPTIYPVFHKNIPIRILNTHNPSAPGTTITDRQHSESVPKGVSALRSTTLIEVKGAASDNVASVNSRIFNSLARKGISVLLVAQAGTSSRIAFTVAAADADQALKSLRSEFAPELSAGSITSISAIPEVSTVALVGEHIRRTPGLGARILNTLQRSGIEVLAAADGASETSLTLVVNDDRCNEALNLLHETFLAPAWKEK